VKPGSENRKKTIAAGALGAVALCCLVYGYNTLFGGSSTPTPPPAIAPVNSQANSPAATIAARSAAANSANTTTSSSGNKSSQPAGGNAPGVAAARLATTSSSLDPTLDETAMLRTESLVYSGTGRNIFSATYTAPVKIPNPIASARIKTPPPPPPVPCPPNCPPPPPPPPINLKFFGTAKRPGGALQAFLLNGEDVYLANEGDIVARKYKIVSITANTIQVTDLQNNNTQSLPLQN